MIKLRSIGLTTIIVPLEPLDCDDESPSAPLPLLLLPLLLVLAALEPLALAVDTGVTFAATDKYLSGSPVKSLKINIPRGSG